MPWARKLAAPRVTSVPFGTGQGAVAQLSVVRGPRSRTVEPFTMTGCRVVGLTRIGGTVVVKGTEATSGMLSATTVRPVARRPVMISVYFASKEATGVS